MYCDRFPGLLGQTSGQWPLRNMRRSQEAVGFLTEYLQRILNLSGEFEENAGNGTTVLQKVFIGGLRSVLGAAG